MKKFLCAVMALVISVTVCVPCVFAGGNSDLIINQENISHQVSPTLYGALVDSSAFANDGGLSANLVSDNSFEYGDNKAHPCWMWENLACASDDADGINPNNPTYKVVTVDGAGTMLNLGYTEVYDDQSYEFDSNSAYKADMGFLADTKYDFSCYIKNIDFDGRISVYLDSKSNSQRKASLNLSKINKSKWNKVSATLTSVANEDGGLAIVFEGKGSLMIDFVSLVAKNSYGYKTDKWQYASLNSGMVNALKNMKPSFVRFSGCCHCAIGGGDAVCNWKNTIGTPEARKYCTDTIGYHEYFQLCEDLGAAAIPTVNAGIICQQHNNYDDYVDAVTKATVSESQWIAYLVAQKGYRERDKKAIEQYGAYLDTLGINSADDFEKYLDSISLRPGTDEFNNYAQDVLDLIEYANGDSKTSYWGALRATNGHSEPFGIQCIAIGNNNWGDLYQRNFDALCSIIKSKYPQITVICATDDAKSDAVISTEYYPADNPANSVYDAFDRDANKVFVSDYTAKNNNIGAFLTKSNISSAMEEAVYMTGFERNSDVVQFATNSPTFAKINANSTDANLVWYDSEQLVFTPNYYVQMLFANNTGKNYIDTQQIADGVYQSVTVDEVKQTIYVKLINTGSKQDVSIILNGFDDITYASNQSISHKYKSASNQLGKNHIAPVDTLLEAKGNTLDVTVEKNSVNVIRIAYGENTGGALYQLSDDFDYRTQGYTPLSVKITFVVIAACAFFVIGAGAYLDKKYHFVKKIKKLKKMKKGGADNG